MQKKIDYTYQKDRPLDELIGHCSSWSAPSNIALVKYWGKKEGIQLPGNPSLSLTLSKALTKVHIEVKDEIEDSWIDLYFEGQKMPNFVPKIEKFFQNASSYIPFLTDLKFTLKTSNTFPHSAGIASSASSMAAIALNLVEMEEKYCGIKLSEKDFFLRASFIARLGSGSACRSVYPMAASWGECEGKGSDLYAEALKIHPIFESMYDSIIVVNSNEKKVSSRAGHGLMENHLYSKARYQQAFENWKFAKEWISDGTWDYLGPLIEEEALSLHAMMMTSRPGYMLMVPETIDIIYKIREYRNKTGVPVYFTLDAGPNLHLLYPATDREPVWKFINELVKQNSESITVIDDKVGTGPSREDFLKLEGGA